jgi:hypothetical protein
MQRYIIVARNATHKEVKEIKEKAKALSISAFAHTRRSVMGA